MTIVDARRAAEQVEQLVERVFAELRDGTREIVDLYAAAGSQTLSIDALKALQPGILRRLEDNHAFQGTGFVVHPDALDEHEQYQEWWLRGPAGRPRKLPLNRDYDYIRRPYFVDASKARLAVEGPYLDYAGSDHFVLTFAVAVIIGDTFAGISGADVTIGSFERLVTPALNAAHGPVVLVNGESRIVASTSSSHGPGDRLSPSAHELVPVAGCLGWSVAGVGAEKFAGG